jgi:hypothetical protein
MDEKWDGPAEVAKADVTALKLMCTWFGGAGDKKEDFKLPHHKAEGGHSVVWAGVRAAMAAVAGARGGVQIPDSDKAGVRSHLARHYAEFGKEPPKMTDLAVECDLGEDLFIEEKEILSKEEVLKPYPNEHACRIVDPAKFDKFARKNCFRKVDQKCVDYIFGIVDNKSTLQSMRFKKEIWTVEEAKKVCSAAKGSFEAASSSSETPDEGKSIVVLGAEMKEMKEILVSIGQTLKSMADIIKLGSGEHQVTSITNGDSSKGPQATEKEESAPTRILGDAFKEGKPKPQDSPHLPTNKSLVTPEGVAKLVLAANELKAVLLEAKKL